MSRLQYFNPSEIRNQRGVIKKALQSESGSSQVIKLDKAREIIRQYASKDSKILDCGPGTGDFLSSLDENGFLSLYAVDVDNYFSPKRLKGFRVADLSFDKIPWPDNFFNIVTAWQVIEHLENPHNFIREASRVLTSDGYFIISMPNIQHIFNRIFFLRKGDMFRWHKKNNHIALFPKGVFEKSFFKYFMVAGKQFTDGEFPYRFLSRFRFPANEWFGRDVIYVLRKKT